MSSTAGKDRCSSGPESSAVLPEFDAEYACSDHAMVRHVVQTAVRNYFSASCTSPAHMTLCIDFTEGAPIPSNSASSVRYQAPLVQINVERKSGTGNTSDMTTIPKGSELSATSTSKGSESSVSGKHK
uniref:Uncharacterized protein n=1 Tax=Setaria digitata TaxID=48799 RepID=A0A915Q388_9BILA